MNYLMQQATDPQYIKGRESALRINRRRGLIAYRAPNGMKFVIDTSPLYEGGGAVVYSEEAKNLPASHNTHTLGSGALCLASSTRGWNLTKILFQCDAWAHGMQVYRATGRFPDGLRQTFSR